MTSARSDKDRILDIFGYFEVDWDQVWTVVERDLEPLRVEVEKILSAERIISTLSS